MKAVAIKNAGVGSVQRCLLMLNVPMSCVYSHSVRAKFGEKVGILWDQSDGFLYGVLELARDNWKRLSIQRHPDRGGDVEQFTATVEAWRRVKRTFSSHGYELP